MRPEAQHPSLRIEFESRLEEIGPNIDRLMAFCAGLLPAERSAGELLEETRLGVTEAVNNVVEHAYRMEPGHPVKLAVEITPTELVIVVVDQGDPVPEATRLQLTETEAATPVEEDPEELLPPLSLEDLDALAEGGWGTMLIQSTIDWVEVRRVDGENHLVLNKRFNACQREH